MVEADAESLALIQERFGFHPLAIEDCASFELRSKIEEYEGYLFIVLHTFTADSDDPGEIQIHEIHAFLGNNYLVTVHDNPVPATERVFARASESSTMLSRGPCWALYSAADSMVDAAFPVLEQMTTAIEQVEQDVVAGHEARDLARIFSMRSTLVQMRRVIRPVRDVVGILSRRREEPLSEATALYFRDAYDHVLRVAETIDEALELIANAMDGYQSAAANRTNEIMARLTFFSVLFLPLGFLTGFWGENFIDLPIRSTALFWVMMALHAAIPAGLLVYFRKKNWL